MRRILFIDDEPSVLDGLRNMLRRHRRVWDMSFAEGGVAGIEAIDAAPFDVVVTDMKMPSVDGAAVLSHLQKAQPDAVRIVLSGYSEMATALRAVPVAHQMLAKPCDPARLAEVIERACGLRDLVNDEAVARAVGTVDQLPSVPETYAALERLLADPESGTRDVAAVVKRDVALSARVLQIVNSSYFSSGRTLTTVDDAVVRIGVGMIKNLALALGLFDKLRAPAAKTFSMARMQSDALRTAHLARCLAEDRATQETAFLAGLLHDAGELIMATHLPDALDEATTLARARRLRQEVAEKELFDVTHAEIGAYLLGIWGLPYSVVEATAHHHLPSRVDTEVFGVLGCVHVAATFTGEISAAEGGVAPPVLDEVFLERTKTFDSIPAWRALAAEEAS